MKTEDQEFLIDLLQTPSPTGFEMPGQRIWSSFLKPIADEVTCDSYGSTWAVLRGKSKRTIMLEAHADEIGYMIKHIDDQGFLRLDRVGGSDAATARGRRLRILGDKGEVTGVIGNTAIHLRRDNLNSEKVPAVHELWVDVGCSSAKEVAELGLRVGHVAVYFDGPFELAHSRIVGRALDNRIGGYIIAKVMKKLAAEKKRPDFTLICLNAVQEEIGGNGAMMATHRLMPELCLCLDVTHATDTPGIDANQFGKVTLGGGPTISHGTANHPLVVERLIKVADREKITLQHEASSRFTGTDTDKIFHTRDGVPSALVSLPLRSMHSVVETAHFDDIHATIQLLGAFVSALKVKDVFHQKL
jgi:endoglucanase